MSDGLPKARRTDRPEDSRQLLYFPLTAPGGSVDAGLDLYKSTGVLICILDVTRCESLGWTDNLLT